MGHSFIHCRNRSTQFVDGEIHMCMGHILVSVNLAYMEDVITKLILEPNFKKRFENSKGKKSLMPLYGLGPYNCYGSFN